MRTIRSIMLLALMVGVAACGDPAPVCGDGVVQGSEACDQGAFGATTVTDCRALGWNGGQVGCRQDCTPDLSPCEATGRCGDGVITPGFEDCDGEDFGGRTCEGQGHHGGELVCTADCRRDESACARCGDGVLQPGYGELVEVDLGACQAAGFFGGVMTTADCLVPRDAYCGEYRVLGDGDGDLSAPVLLADGSGGLWLGGVTTGAPGGAGAPGCPALVPFERATDDGPAPDGWRLDPGCARGFLGRLGAATPLEVLRRDDDDARVVSLIDAGAHGMVRVRGTGSDVDLDLVGPDGTRLAFARLPAPPNPHQWVSAGPDRIALLSHVYQPYLGHFLLTLVDLPDLTAVGPYVLDRITAGPVEYHFYRAYRAPALHVQWAGGRSFHVVANLTTDADFGTYLLTLTVRDGRLRLDALVPLTTGFREAQAIWLARVTPEADRVVLLHMPRGYSGEPTRVSLDTFTLRGTQLAHRSLFFPIMPEVVRPTPDGGFVVAGPETRNTPDSTVDPRCVAPVSQGFHSHLAAYWFDADGAPAGERRFFLPSWYDLEGQSAAGDAVCETGTRSWTQVGDTLYVAGTYDRARPFCTPDEPITLFELQDVHACGVFVVRLAR